MNILIKNLVLFIITTPIISVLAMEIKPINILEKNSNLQINSASFGRGDDIAIAGLNTATFDRFMKYHKEAISSLAFNMDKTKLVTASCDKTAKVWDVETGETLHHLIKKDSWALFHTDYSPSGDRILTTSLDGTATLWNADTGEEIHSFPASYNKKGPIAAYSSTFSTDGDKIIIAYANGRVRVWEAAEPYELMHVFEAHKNDVYFTNFSPDDTMIVTVSKDNTAKVWDAETYELRHVLCGHKKDVISADFSPDNTMIVTTSFDGSAKMWDTETGEIIYIFDNFANGVKTVEFNQDGTKLLLASFKMLQVWVLPPKNDIKHWQEIKQHLQPYLDTLPEGISPTWEGFFQSLEDDQLIADIKYYVDSSELSPSIKVYLETLFQRPMPEIEIEYEILK